MELRVYRQKATVLKDGLTVYSGEDGLPYVDDHLILAADGLGGTGAVRHPSVNRDVFERDTVVNAFFRGVYDDLDEGEFADYVKRSFTELYEMKDYVGKNMYAVKKSSYLGSRLALSILLHHFKNDADLNAGQLLDTAASLSGAEREEYLTRLGDKVKGLLREDLHKVAVNANIFYESSVSGLKLLATTICATVYTERDDCVDALYFIAGDSRPYFWSETDGLCQITADLEGEDGGMTSCVYEGGDFGMSCLYFRFRKPCVLFNASDGCFESVRFLSQMAFEQLILDTIVNNDGQESVEKALVSIYDTYGTHDDSSTLALKSFGWGSDNEFREACRRRLAVLQEKYLSQMDDLLTTDYMKAFEQTQKGLKTGLAPVKARFAADPAVCAWCEDHIRSAQYPPYLEAMKPIDAAVDSERKKRKKAMDTIYELAARNFMRLSEYGQQQSDWFSRVSLYVVNKRRDKCKELADDYISELEGFRRDFARSAEAVRSLLEQICKTGVPESFEDFDGLDFGGVEQSKRTFAELFDFFSDLKKKKAKTVKRLLEERDLYFRQNKDLAGKHPEELRAVCALILEKRIDIEKADIGASDRRAILKALAEIDSAKAAVRELETVRRPAALSAVRDAYLDKEYASAIAAVMKNADIPVEPSLRSELAAIIDDYQNKARELREKAQLQEKLFDAYQSGYEKIMRGEINA